jgi:hypothetical protein
LSREEGIWQNPFEKSLVEDWRLEEFPQNFKDVVACFFPPDFMHKLESTDLKPKILMGGRGSGKSHVLRMLSVQSIINKTRFKKAEKKGESFEETKLKLREYDTPYFGIYLKATVFSPLSQSNVPFLTKEQLKSLFEHLFNMYTGITMLESTRFLTQAVEDIQKEKEAIVCSKLCNVLGPTVRGKNFPELIDSLHVQVKMIQKLLKEFPWYNDFSRFEGKIDFTSSPDFIEKMFDAIRNEILGEKVLFVLLDEYDEFDKYQQEFMNFLIRTRRLTFRIASKIGGIRTLEYSHGKELDEIHDYDPIIPLHFDTSADRIADYRKLLANVFTKRLIVYGEYGTTEPEEILPSPMLSDEGLTEEDVQKCLTKIHEGLRRTRKVKDLDKYWENFENHYREAAIYRILRDRGKDKLYAGFDEYVSLSSGIVRQFILLCREAFASARLKKIDIERGDPIPPRIQSDAAEKVSRTQLLSELTKSIPSGYGPKLVRIIQDLGRILQAKLYWSSEPQANKFEIVDSQKLANIEYRIPKELIENGLRMPHFISETAFKPKIPEYSLSFAFSLNGIFAPVLKVPPEKRWPTPINADELRDLCSDERREDVLKKIIQQIRGKERIVRGIRRKNRGKPERTLIESLSDAITLTNCPVTGFGCDKNLHEYMLELNSPKAFLGVPFDSNSWVGDPRRWIKNAMTDHFRMRCVDIDDFPAMGPLLCKICSCVRQMPIGLFEITELNPNVVFELGMGTGLNKLGFLLVYPEKIPSELKGNFPPRPLDNTEYVSYELSENAVIKAIEKKIVPEIRETTKHGRNGYWCFMLRRKCPVSVAENKSKVFVGLPHERNPDFFREVEKLLKDMIKTKEPHFFKPARSLNELCQLCKEVRESSFCIVDTTYNDTSMLFSLGVAFGRDKKFIQLHNTSLDFVRPISDIRPWAIEYGNIERLREKLEEELRKRLK